MEKGKIIQFRRGRHTITERQYLIDTGAKNIKEASKFIGSKVSWKSPAGKIISGKISNTHGNKGIVRAIFEKGLPGQAVTENVDIELNKSSESKK
jgi:large subunit ribosomal protein L35Ae